MSVLSLTPNYGFAPTAGDVADRLSDLAEKIRSGEFDSLIRVVVIIDELDKTHEPLCYGQSTTNGELIGSLEYAKHTVLSSEAGS